MRDFRQLVGNTTMRSTVTIDGAAAAEPCWVFDLRTALLLKRTHFASIGSRRQLRLYCTL